MVKINITSRHFKAHETLQEYIKTKIENLERYNEEIFHSDVILSFEKAANSVMTCEIIMKLRDKTITSKENADEFPKAIDKTINKIETQLLKYKDKHKNHKKVKPDPAQEII